MSYFIWKGVDSRTMGLLVGVLPAIERGQERVEQIIVPGRRGVVTFTEGADILEPLARTCTVYAQNDRSYYACMDWLRGEGEAVFSNEPDRVYYARIVEAVRFQPDGNSLRKADIVFLCDPYKGQWPKEPNISVTSYATQGSAVAVDVYNPGDVAARPIIHMPPVTSGSVGQITIGTQTYEFSYKENVTNFMLDCESGICLTNLGYDSDIFQPTNSGVPTIPKGTSAVTAVGFSAGIVIEPRWRWV